MPLPKDLRLSRDPYYRALIAAGDYEGAARHAMMLYHDVFGIDPRVDDSKAFLPRHERAAFFDAPTNAEAIERHAKISDLWSKHGVAGEQIGMEMALRTLFGSAAQPVAESLPKAAKNFFASWGLGEREEARPSAPASTKVLQGAMELGLQMAPFIGATKAISGVRGLQALGKAGTRKAATLQAATTLGTAGGLTELGRQVSIDVNNRLGLTGMEPEYGEVPLAAVSFAAGGVPWGRPAAAALQAGVSAVGQMVFKGEVDPQRVLMEGMFAGVFGNPQFKELRNQAIKMTPALAKKIEAAHNTANPKTRATQLYKDGDVARAAYIEELATFPTDVLKKLRTTVEAKGDEAAARVIRDAIAQQNGDIVVGVHAEAPSRPPQRPAIQRTRKLSMKDKVAKALYDNPEGLTVEQVSTITGLKIPSVQRALRRWDNPRGEGTGTGIIQRMGADPNAGVKGRQRYALTEAEQKSYKPPEVDEEGFLANEIGTQMDEASRKAEDFTLPQSVREAAEAEVFRLSDMMDQLAEAKIDPKTIKPEEAKGIVVELLAGRTKGEIEGWLADAAKMPDELRPWRRAITESIGDLFRKFPDDDLLKAQAEALLPRLVEPQARIRYLQDIPKDEASIRNIAAQWDTEVRKEGSVWVAYRRGRLRHEAPTLDGMHEFINIMARGRAVKTPKRHQVESIIQAARSRGWDARMVGNGKIRVYNQHTGQEVIHTLDDAVDFVNKLPEEFDVSLDKLGNRNAETGAPTEATQADKPATVESRPTTTTTKEFKYEIEEVIPEQRYKLKDNETGGTRYFGTRKQAEDYAEQLVAGKVADPTMEKPEKPDDGTPEAVADDEVVVEPVAEEAAGDLAGQRIAGTTVQTMEDAATSQLVPSDWVPPGPQEPKQRLVGAPGRIARAFRPIADLLKNYEDIIGLPLYREIWDKVNTQMSLRDLWLRPLEESLAKIHKGIPNYRQHVVQQLVMAEDKKAAAVLFQASEKELAASYKMRDWYKEVLDLTDDELHRFLHVGMPKIRAVDGDLSKLEDYTLPGGMSELMADLGDEGAGRAMTTYLRLQDDNALGVARDILFALGRKRFMGEVIANARAMERRLLSTSQRDPKNADVYEGAKEVVRTYMDSVTHMVPQDAVDFARAHSQWTGMLKKLRLIDQKTKTLTPQDVERMVMMTSSWYSGLAMSWRTALAVRNMVQSTLSAPKVGFKRAFQGVHDALYPSNWQELKDLGVIAQPAMFGYGRVGARAGMGYIKPKGPGIVDQMGRIEHAGRQVQAAGLWLYRSADKFNRAASYYAGKRALKGSWDNYLASKQTKADLDNFYVESGLALDSRSFQRDMARMLGKGQVEEAAKEYGKHVTRITQYLYSRPNAPQFFHGTKARLIGQFGIWPAGYFAYLEQAGGWHHLFTEPFKFGGRQFRKLGYPFGVEPRARTPQSAAREQFIMRTWAQRAAIVGLGSLLGIDTSNWNQANMFAFEGGPALQLTSDVFTTLTQTGSEFDRAMARSSIKRLWVQIGNPVGALTDDVYEALEAAAQGNNYEAFLRGLGFNTKGMREGRPEALDMIRKIGEEMPII